MRLSEERIHFVADQIIQSLKQKDMIEASFSDHRLRREIVRVIIQDLRIEDEIDQEVIRVIQSMEREVPEDSPEWISIFRQKKFSYYFFRSQRDPEERILGEEVGPVIHIASRMMDDTPGKVKVFSNCDEVELFVNDKSLGVQKPDKDILIKKGQEFTAQKLYENLTSDPKIILQINEKKSPDLISITKQLIRINSTETWVTREKFDDGLKRLLPSREIYSVISIRRNVNSPHQKRIRI